MTSTAASSRDTAASMVVGCRSVTSSTWPPSAQAVTVPPSKPSTIASSPPTKIQGRHRRRHAKNDHNPQRYAPRSCCMAATIRLSQQHSCSFDHLVGDGEQPRREGQAKRFRGLQVDDELEFGGPQHWQVRRLLAFENASYVDTGLTIRVFEVGAVGHQSARVGELAQIIDHRDGMACCQCNQLFAPTEKKWIVADDEGTEPLLGDCYKRRVDFAFAAGVKDINVKPQRASGRLQLFGLGIGILAGR